MEKMAIRDSWAEYRHHAKTVVGWIADAGSRLNDPNISSKAPQAMDSPLFAELVAGHCATAGVLMPSEVTKSARHCLAVNERFEAWVAHQRGNHKPPEPRREDQPHPSLDAKTFRRILRRFENAQGRTAGAATSPSAPPQSMQQQPKRDSGAFHSVPLGVYLLFSDMDDIRQNIKRVWEGYRAREVSLQAAAVLTHSAWEAVEAFDGAATSLGAPPTHGAKIGSLYLYLALNEMNGQLGRTVRQFNDMMDRYNTSGFQPSPELQAWVMRDVSRMLLDTRGCSDERPLRVRLHPDLQHLIPEFKILLWLRRVSGQIPRQPHLQRFLDLLTVHLSREPEDSMQLMTFIFTCSTILDIHKIDLVIPMAYWEMNVARYSLREQQHRPGDSPNVRSLKETHSLLRQWVDPTIFFPGKSTITINPVLSGLVTYLLAETQHALLVSEAGVPSPTPNLRYLWESYISPSEKGKLDCLGRPAPHLEHRFGLLAKDWEEKEEALAASDMCNMGIDGLLKKVEDEIQIILPFSLQLTNLSRVL